MVDKETRRLIEARLRKIALEDGEMSEDEQVLMSSIILDLEQYSSHMERARQDGKISDQEERKLFERRMEILEKAYETARDDKHVSQEEMNILKEICKIIRNLD